MPGRTPYPADNPLHAWLTRKKLTRAAFADRCSEVLRQPVRANTVHKWASGWQRPGRMARDLIAKATRGEVPVTVAWPASKRKDKQPKRRRAA